ncbi:GAF domain-containing protein [archaeon]|nr:MAG: GAF domain-containing protein [archaeon]
MSTIGDLDTYERIHEIGFIQDEGYLLTVTFDNQVAAMSENFLRTPWFRHTDASKVLGKTLSEVFPNDPRVSHELEHLIQLMKATPAIPSSVPPLRFFSLVNIGYMDGDKSLMNLFCCVVVGCGNQHTCIIEFEEVKDYVVAIPNFQMLHAGDIVGRLHASDSIPSVTWTFLSSVMEKLPHYDRGMIYCFGEDASGEVLHEIVRDPSSLKSSYLNLRFPAEDIPPQARALFTKNGVRYICNASGEDSRVLSVGDEPIDLTMSFLRAVSKCHIQYLRNMGIVASLSIALVVDDRLWGLCVLHSYSKPTRPTVEERVMLEMAASICAMRIRAFQQEHSTRRQLELNQVILTLGGMSSVQEFLLKCYRKILDLMGTHALVLYEEGNDSIVFGDNTIVPTAQGYQSLLAKCKMNSSIVLHSFPEGLQGMGAGIIFYHRQHFKLALIRRSKVSDVKWGGNPDPVQDPSVPRRLCPRSSFELYVETGKTESIAWSSADTSLVDVFVERLSHFMHQEMLQSFRLSLEQSNEKCLQAVQSAKEHYEFFAHMSHELRTPFHGVMCTLQILDQAGPAIGDVERMELTSSALECGRTMLRTLDDILTIAKSHNHVDIAKSPFMLVKILNGCKRLMTPVADQKGLVLETVFVGDRNLVVIGDETRTSQIANNLINNALKFTTKGTVKMRGSTVQTLQDVWQLWTHSCSRFEGSHITVGPDMQLQINDISLSSSLSAEQESGVTWYVHEVEDSGCGVSSEDLSRIFDAYKQLSSGVSKVYQGTGLGLHICRLHVELMGGILGVASTLGVGTVFMFALPLNMFLDKLVQEEEEITGRKRPRLHPDEDKIDNIGSTVQSVATKDDIYIVVDDSNVNLRLTKRKIQLTLGNDVTVRTAVDGLEAIELYHELLRTGKQGQVRGIFMDYHMPRCSGLDAIIEIRKKELHHIQTLTNSSEDDSSMMAFTPCYIIAFTADLSETSRKGLINAGANEVLAKPTPSGEMETICNRLQYTKTRK